MLLPTALVLLLAGPAAAAVNFMAAVPAPERRHAGPLLPRQTGITPDDVSAECLTAAQSVLRTMPTPPPEVLSELERNPQTDPCSFSTPASLTRQFSAYSSELEGWASRNDDKLSACSALSRFDVVASCSRAKAAATSTSTDSGSSSSSSSSSSTRSGNAAARQTGMAVAARAVAGLAAVAL